MPSSVSNNIPGNDPLLIRAMRADDLSLCRRLVSEAGWNQTDGDWMRAMKLDPDGCFVAEKGAVAVATTTCCRFGETGWIAMVLVDPVYRGFGIAGRLVQHAIACLQHAGAKSIRLDATAMGQKVYRKLGFREEYEVIRYEGIAGKEVSGVALQPVLSTDALMDEIAAIDRKATGTGRRVFLENLDMTQAAAYCWKTDREGTAEGYAGFRVGRNAVQIGPAAAFTEHAGQMLLDSVLDGFPGRACFIDIPAENKPAMRWAESRGFKIQRSFVRMYLGEKPVDRPDWIWACSGPEKG
jgi:GNAT superfamily N-acetyltransferase